MTIEVGTTVTWGAHEYVIKDLINSGGFGDAYRAERTKPTPGEVVVKVPAAHVSAHPIWSKKFAREARILANIKHPNVVKIVAFWEFPDGEKALVQELVRGAKDLNSFVAANPTHTPSLFLQALYALRAFHDQASPSAVHRDLSPANILVGADGVVKIIDFGLAKEDPRLTEILTQAGTWFGTPGCMSPEQVSDAANVDHRTDLFALGRSFAAALQNRHPAATRPEKLSEPWKTLCVKLTEDDAADRFQSAADAIPVAMTLFASAGLPIENFEFHVAEMRRTPVALGWPDLVQSYCFALDDYEQEEIRLLGKLGAAAFAPPFDANAFLDLLEESTALGEFDTNSVSFEDGDPLGDTYANLYGWLDIAHKLVCFRRLVKTAIRLHRYPVMGDVRAVYGSESNPAVRVELQRILNEEDGPPFTIHGRGVIPGRSP